MAVETLVLPDSVKTWAIERSPGAPQKAIVGAVEFVVKKGVDPAASCIILQGEALRRIAKVLGRVVDSPEGLCSAVEKANAYTVNGSEVALSATQKDTLARQARDARQEPDVFLNGLFRDAIAKELGY